MNRIHWTWAIVLALVASFAVGKVNAEESKSAKLGKGSRIVFLGDSITQAGVRPEGYVTLVREHITKAHPDAGIEVIGAGISGNRVPDIQSRLDRDVLSHKPTLVVIYIGINDVWHSTSGRGTPKDQYAAGLRDVVSRIQSSGAGVILCTPSVIGEKSHGSNKLDKMLDEYSEISRNIARDTKSSLLDLRKAFIKYLAKNNSEDAEKGVLTTDGVHLNPQGNKFVARQMLRALRGQSKGHHSHRKLRHVVLFKFKDDASAEQVKKVIHAFIDLPNKIDVIESIEWGTDNSPEGLAEGFTHCFLLTFANAQDRDAYLPHPAHKAFGASLRPILDKVLVVDYWSHK